MILRTAALRMDHAIANVMRLAGVSLVDAVRMATVNPARVGAVPGRANGLAASDRADFVLFSFDPQSRSIRIEETYVSGRRVYQC